MYDADPQQLWIRDWALIGGITSTLAPGLVGATLFPLLIDSGFVLVAGGLGLISGAFVGGALRGLLRRVPARFHIGVATLVGAPLLSLWGTLVSLGAAWWCLPQWLQAAWICGGLSALVQCAWMAPAYAWLAREQRSRFAAVVLGSVLGGPLCGLLCIFTVLGLPALVGALLA